MQPYPSMINTNPGDTTASIPILEEEKGYVLYVWNHDQDAIWDSKKLTECNCKQTHRIAMEKWSKAMRQKLKAGPGYEEVEAATSVIDLLRLIKRLIYNYQIYEHLIQAVHKSLRKFYTLQQVRRVNNQEYLQQFQLQVDAI